MLINNRPTGWEVSYYPTVWSSQILGHKCSCRTLIANTDCTLFPPIKEDDDDSNSSVEGNCSGLKTEPVTSGSNDLEDNSDVEETAL